MALRYGDARGWHGKFFYPGVCDADQSEWLAGGRKIDDGAGTKSAHGGKLLDNHAILNVGSALADGGTAEYYELVLAVRSIAFAAILKTKSTLPIILTNVVARGGTAGFLEENCILIGLPHSLGDFIDHVLIASNGKANIAFCLYNDFLSGQSRLNGLNFLRTRNGPIPAFD
ncbi:UNVERIFIED_ORG: hypothetical protein GGD59_006692 [Rhizobium esperanzae]